MNRWWGNKDDSDKQAADRSSRAARRTIAQQLVLQSDSEDDYEDCDTSGIFGGLDGANDLDDSSSADMLYWPRQHTSAVLRKDWGGNAGDTPDLITAGCMHRGCA